DVGQCRAGHVESARLGADLLPNSFELGPGDVVVFDLCGLDRITQQLCCVNRESTNVYAGYYFRGVERIKMDLRCSGRRRYQCEIELDIHSVGPGSKPARLRCF